MKGFFTTMAAPLGRPALADGPALFSAPRPRPRLGETEQTWYARAKAAVAKYDDLAQRTRAIADPAYASGVLARFRRNPADPKGALYRRNSVAFAVADAESRAPADYSAFGRPEIQKKVEELEGWNREFERSVAAGEESRGVRIPELGQQAAPPAAAPAGRPVTFEDCAPWVVLAVLVGGVAFIALSD